MFASVGFNAQFGHFERRFLDFTKLGVQLDVGAASALMSAISSGSQGSSSQGWPTCERGRPTLAVCLQQQVLGPLRARVDSRVSVDPSNLKQQPAVQEIICGLDYPLDASGAAKLCVWYSPTRREGMAEFSRKIGKKDSLLEMKQRLQQHRFNYKLIMAKRTAH